jgi:hypothetical protein
MLNSERKNIDKRLWVLTHGAYWETFGKYYLIPLFSRIPAQTPNTSFLTYTNVPWGNKK